MNGCIKTNFYLLGTLLMLSALIKAQRVTMPNGKAYNMVLGHLPKISAFYPDNLFM